MKDLDEMWWRPAERYIGICAKCGREGLKKHMATLHIRANGYSPLRTLCNICQNCLPALLDDLEVSMPE